MDTDRNPDFILYEPKQKEIYALNHTGNSATVIDAATGKVVATIPLAGTAEAGQADPALGRVYVNIEDKNSVDVIDIATHKVVANWSVTPAVSPTGMAIDTATHRLYTAAQNFAAADPAAAAAAPAPGARGRGPAPVPDSFHVLVFDRK